MRLLLLTLYGVILGFLPGWSATIGEETMVNLTLNDGLAGETVNHVMTDHLGYTWIATTGGISIFNGRNLMTMRITDAKGHPQAVNYLCETSRYDIYAATEDGLYRLTFKSGHFERVLPEIERPISLLAVGDTLYIGGEQGLQVYDGRRLKRHDVGASRKGLDNIVRHYVQDGRGGIWFLGRYDLSRYDPTTERIEHYESPLQQGGHYALSQFDIADGKLWIGSRNGGLLVYDLKTNECHRVDGVGKIVISVRRSKDGLVAVATDGTGAYLIDPKTEQVVERFATDATGINRLPTNALYSFYRDDRGVNWFGTVRHGLVYHPYNSHLFKPYELDGQSTSGMNVRSFLIRGRQAVIGLQDGLWLMDADRHLHRYFTPEELGGHIVNNIQWWQGQYVIGQYDGGVRLLNPQTASLSGQSWSPLLSQTTVGDIKVAPDSSLWIGCSDGLFIIRPDGSIRQLTEQNSRITGGVIIDITFDAEGNAWLTGAKGLSVYSSVSRDIVDTNFPVGFFHREGYMRGVLGHDNLIYMRNGPQLFYTTSHMERFGELALPVTLTDRWCRGMVDNMAGWLWLASERGLLGFDYEGHGLIQLGEGEGLSGSQINELRMDGTGRLWVATSEGLFSATRKDLTQWQNADGCYVTLYNVRIGSDLLTGTAMSDLSEQNHITLTWNLTSQVFQAEPILLDYARQKGRFYEYCVDGGEWQLIDDNQPVDVRHLLLGSHQLTVRMAGVKGTETRYRLSVVPSGWAVFELILLVVALALLWLWWCYRKNTKVLLDERNEIEDALVEVESELQKEESKYERVRIDEKECAGIVKRVREYIERERVYTNQDLKMKDLADVLHLSAPKLSQVFNLYLKENYYEFINRYRLQEFKRLIEAGEYKRYTITALSEQCGFKKSNFFSTFRKVEGMTPAEYLKKQGVKV